jgi:signal peptidase
MSVVRKVKPLLGAMLLCTFAISGILAWHNGYRLFIVHTGSMAPTILAGDVVLDGPPKAAYRAGEVITFRHSDRSTDLVTHSVIDFKGGVIHTKGDANRTADVWNIRPDQVQGVVLRRLPRLGYLFVFLKQPLGLASVLFAGIALVLVRKVFSPSTADESKPESPGKPPSSPPAIDVALDPAENAAPESPAKAGSTQPIP